MNRQIGVADSKNVIVLFLPPTHGSRDSAHAQWPRSHFQYQPVRNVITRNSATDRRRVFILGGKVGHVIRPEWQLFKVKRAKVKVTRSRDVSADKNAITRLCMHISTSNVVGIIYVGSTRVCILSRSVGRKKAEVEIWRIFSMLITRMRGSAIRCVRSQC